MRDAQSFKGDGKALQWKGTILSATESERCFMFRCGYQGVTERFNVFLSTLGIGKHHSGTRKHTQHLMWANIKAVIAVSP